MKMFKVLLASGMLVSLFATANPLDNIKIHADVTMIKNSSIFDQEREVIKVAFSDHSEFYWMCIS